MNIVSIKKKSFDLRHSR